MSSLCTRWVQLLAFSNILVMTCRIFQISSDKKSVPWNSFCKTMNIMNLFVCESFGMNVTKTHVWSSLKLAALQLLDKPIREEKTVDPLSGWKVYTRSQFYPYWNISTEGKKMFPSKWHRRERVCFLMREVCNWKIFHPFWHQYDPVSYEKFVTGMFFCISLRAK